MVTQTVTIDLAAQGVRVRNWTAISAELQNDWRRETGEQLAGLFATGLPNEYQSFMLQRSIVVQGYRTCFLLERFHSRCGIHCFGI
jgi:hypothetical protein